MIECLRILGYNEHTLALQKAVEGINFEEGIKKVGEDFLALARRGTDNVVREFVIFLKDTEPTENKPVVKNRTGTKVAKPTIKA